MSHSNFKTGGRVSQYDLKSTLSALDNSPNSRLEEFMGSWDLYVEKRIRELLPTWLAWMVLVKRWKAAMWMAGISIETINSPITGNLNDGFVMKREYKVIRTSPLIRFRRRFGKGRP